MWSKTLPRFTERFNFHITWLTRLKPWLAFSVPTGLNSGVSRPPSRSGIEEAIERRIKAPRVRILRAASLLTLFNPLSTTRFNFGRLVSKLERYTSPVSKTITYIGACGGLED